MKYLLILFSLVLGGEVRRISTASLSPHPSGAPRLMDEAVYSAFSRADTVMEASLVVKVVAVILIAEFPQCCRALWEPTPGKANLSKRSAGTFPPDSALQINAGITLAGRLKSNTAVIVLAFQQNAPLPNGPVIPSARQFSIYNYLKNILISYGFDGMECLRKMVCQMGEAPLMGGLVEDVIAFLLSPSKHRSVRFGGTERERRDVELLLESEILGRRGGNCTSAFPKCSRTPLDMISTFVPV